MDFVSDMDGHNTRGIFRLSAPANDIAAARNQIEVFVASAYAYAHL
jgi:hypothetical protein